MDPHEFLRAGRVLRLATVDAQGMPHVVPVWYVYRDDTVYIGTNTRSAKAVNILRTGVAAFCVDKGVRSPLYGVMGRGDAGVITDASRVREISGAILLRYFDSLEEPVARELMDDTDCIISVRVRRLTSWT